MAQHSLAVVFHGKDTTSLETTSCGGPWHAEARLSIRSSLQSSTIGGIRLKTGWSPRPPGIFTSRNTFQLWSNGYQNSLRSPCGALALVFVGLYLTSYVDFDGARINMLVFVGESTEWTWRTLATPSLNMAIEASFV